MAFVLENALKRYITYLQNTNQTILHWNATYNWYGLDQRSKKVIFGAYQVAMSEFG